MSDPTPTEQERDPRFVDDDGYPTFGKDHCICCAHWVEQVIMLSTALAEQRDEREKWERACIENAENYKAAILLADRRRLALQRAVGVFRRYEGMHRAKCTQEGDRKADANAHEADMCDAALRRGE